MHNELLYYLAYSLGALTHGSIIWTCVQFHSSPGMLVLGSNHTLHTTIPITKIIIKYICKYVYVHFRCICYILSALLNLEACRP